MIHSYSFTGNSDLGMEFLICLYCFLLVFLQIDFKYLKKIGLYLQSFFQAEIELRGGLKETCPAPSTEMCWVDYNSEVESMWVLKMIFYINSWQLGVQKELVEYSSNNGMMNFFTR